MEAKAGIIDEIFGKVTDESGEAVKGAIEVAESPNLRVLSVDKVTVEKYVLEGNGSREVLLTKNESSRRLSVESEPGSTLLRRSKDEKRESSTKSTFRISLPQDPFTSKLAGGFRGGPSKLPISKNRRNSSFGTSIERRIKPIKLTKAPSIGSLTPGNSKTLKSSSIPAKRNKVPPKVPDKPDSKKLKDSLRCLSPSLGRRNDSEDKALRFNANVGKEKNGGNEELKNLDKAECVPGNEKNEDSGNSVIGKNEKQTVPNEKVEAENVEHQIQIPQTKKKDSSNSDNAKTLTKLDIDPQNLLEKSQSKIEVLQRNLGTKIHASTAQSYKEKLLGLRSILSPKVSSSESTVSDEKTSSAVKFDEEFIEKHNLDKRLKIEEKGPVETDLDYISNTEKAEICEDDIASDTIAEVKQKYSEKVSEVEKRWSGDFLHNRFDRNSSESSKSSYIEEFGSVSSRESIIEDNHTTFLDGYKLANYSEKKPSTDEEGKRISGEIPENSTASTLDSDSCFEDRIKAADEIIENIEAAKSRSEKDEQIICEESTAIQPEEEIDAELAASERKNPERKEAQVEKDTTFFVEEKGPEESSDSATVFPARSQGDGYANLIQEFIMEPGSSRIKKEEKQKKKLGFRRLLPGFFSPKDARKEYSKKEQKERRKHDERHFARYQQNGSYTRSPDTLNLNEDIKRNVNLDTSLNGSIIEERLDEIKRELFPEQGLITSTPDHFSKLDDQFLHDRSRVPRCCTTDSSLSSIAHEDRWSNRGVRLSGSPDVRKHEQRQKRDDQKRYGQLERKHSLQEPNHGSRNVFFVRNHGPSGRISAPPGERFLVRPRAVHPVDRPLPAIPYSRVELSNYENYQGDEHYLNQPGFYENGREQHMDPPNLILTPVSAQVKITRQPIVNQNQKAPLVGRSPKYPSPGSSQKSGDYADSSCTPNSSQKSEFSPTSSKSGEYYLNSPRNSARASPNDREFGDLPRDDIYENQGPISSARIPENYIDDRVYDETPPPGEYLSNSRGEKHVTSLQTEKCLPNFSEKESPQNSQREQCSSNCSQQNYSPRREQQMNTPVFQQKQHSPRVKQQEFSPSWQQTQFNAQREKRSPKGSRMENRGKEELDRNKQSQMFNENIEKTSATCDDRSKVEEGVRKEEMPVMMVTDNSAVVCPSNKVVDILKIPPPTTPIQCRTTSTVTSPSGSRVSVTSRRSQPNDQILIASPKREMPYESRTHISVKESEQARPDSPVPLTDSTIDMDSKDEKYRQPSQSLSCDGTGGRRTMSPSYPLRLTPDNHQSESVGRRTVSPNSAGFAFSNNIQKPEAVYGIKKLPCLPISESVERISGVASADQKAQNIYNNPKSSANKISSLSGRRALSPPTVSCSGNEPQRLNLTGRRTPTAISSSCPSSDVQCPATVYGSRKLFAEANVPSRCSDVKSEGHEQVHPVANNHPSQSIQPTNETVAWVQSQAVSTSSPRNLTAEQGKLRRDISFEETDCTNRQINESPVQESAFSELPITHKKKHIHQDANLNNPRTNLHKSNLPVRQEKVYVSRELLQREPISEQQQRLHEQLRHGQDLVNAQRSSEPLYVQRSQSPGVQQGSTQSGLPSPSKKQTMQHLEAFYWQQKALEAQRKSSVSPANANLRRNSPKIDMPQVREAVYWQHLKKLDEEQQRKIYEQNVLEEKMYDQNYWKSGCKNYLQPISSAPVQRSPANRITESCQPPPANSDSTLNYEDKSFWSTQQRGKGNSIGKPPLMQGQKGQNQPVLIVRPQQTIQQRHENPQKALDSPDFAGQDVLRVKTASPHLHRSDVQHLDCNTPGKSNADSGTAGEIVTLRKTDTSYEETQQEGEGKPTPPPIFKRGSLISGENMEYGNTGPKRVSFSNQSNMGRDVTTGNWPTKHGSAPEPPTRRHRSEDCSSDNDSVFSHSDNRNQDGIYTGSRKNAEGEYDANRPLPPPPKECGWTPRRSPATVGRNLPTDPRWYPDADPRRVVSPANYKKWSPGTCESESGSETAGEVQRIFRPPQALPAGILNRPRTGCPAEEATVALKTLKRLRKMLIRWKSKDKSSSKGSAGGAGTASKKKRKFGREEEEWNSDGKGRQSNDTGGSGRAEGEPGSNELSSGGRRSGGGGGGGVLGIGGVGRTSSGSSGGGRSRDEPRRHTLGGDHQPSLHHQQFNAAQQLHPLHPHHLPPPHGQYGTPPARHTTMDLEMGTKSRQRKSPLPRGYPPPSSTMLFDDDPGIMSEVETSSTGFRRGGKQRSSLPVVRTPSKTLERPLGLVFLQYRNETKRALLPNEITSIDTVKALFVRSFPKQLTMEYLDSPHVKVYIHDSNKDMFYELEDLRSHLRDIRDRSVLRLFESTDGVTGMPGPLGVPGGGTGLPPHWEDQSYFSEPEFDSEYQHQHIHKSKTAKNSTSGGGGYYVGGSSTLPRGGPLLRAYSPAASSVVAGPNTTPTQPKPLATPGGGVVPPAKPLRSYQCGKSPLGSLGGSARFSRDSSVSLYSIPDRLHGESGYMSSPERGGSGRYPPGPYSAGSSYEDPYYSQYSGTVTPVIDEEASDTELLEESYSLYGVKPAGRPTSGPPRSPFPPGAPASLPPGGQSYDVTRIRVEHMERQLANLTGLVQKALTHAPHPSPSPRDYLQVPAGRDPYARAAGAGDEFDKHSSSSSASLPVSDDAVTDDSYLRTDVKPPKLGKDKSVSFEKSVSFSDEPPDMNSPKQHSPQHAADTKPAKPAIKSSTLPRMSSQERDRHKPTPPPKPAALVAGQYVYRDLALTPEMYNQLRGLQKKAKDLRQEVRNLRRMSQAQAHTVRETIRDTFITIRAMLLSGVDATWMSGDAEKVRLSREEDLYKQEMIRLEKDLTELESTVEELRGNVINRKTRVNMSDVENMALILSKSSKTVADLKVRFPSLQEGMKGLLSSEMEKVVREEKFLKEEPERLESALRRCKKLTGTLVTLKRLASVQEQRLPNASSVDAEETPPITPTSAQHSKTVAPVPAERTVVGSASVIGGGSHPHEPPPAHQQRPENALDALLDELQTFSRPSSQLGHSSGPSSLLSDIGRPTNREVPAQQGLVTGGTRPPSISDIGRKSSVDSSTGMLSNAVISLPGQGGTLRRLHSYPSSSDTDTSPPIARLQVSLQEQPGIPVLPPGLPGQKPPVPERNAELLQLASARRVPPPPPPRTSSRSPLASPTSPQLPPRNPCATQNNNATLRRPAARASIAGKECKPPMALPPDATTLIPSDSTMSGAVQHNSTSSQSSAVLSTSNSSSCESVNSQEGLQSKRGRQEQLEQRHQELLRKQKALQEQYARLQQLQRNAAGLTSVPPTPPDLLKKTGSESNLLAKMGLGLSTASSGSLTSLTIKPTAHQDSLNEKQNSPKPDLAGGQGNSNNSGSQSSEDSNTSTSMVMTNTVVPTTSDGTAVSAATGTTTTSKIYETDIL